MLNKKISTIWGIAIIVVLAGAVIGVMLWVNNLSDIKIIDRDLKEKEIVEEIDGIDFTVLEGTWVRIGSNQFVQSIIEISDVTPESFTFEIDAFSGTHEGGFLGIANIVRNKAFFEDEKFEVRFVFTTEGDILILEGENLEIYSGAGVWLSGKYKKDLETEEITLVDVKVLNEIQEREFKNIVSEDYDLFKNFFHIIYEEDDLDDIDATVYRGGVRGIPSAGIIMIIPENQFIAAVIYKNKANYYTNIDKYKKIIPKTIKEWAKDLPLDIKTDNIGFFLTPPVGWDVEVKDEGNDSSFSFIPPEGIPSGWNFWGVLHLSVYKSQPNIDEWIKQHYPDFKDEYNLVGKKRKDIGGKPVFLVEPENLKDKPWLPRYVILGDNYSYVYSFSQDGAMGFIERIEKEIFPNIIIQ